MTIENSSSPQRDYIWSERARYWEQIAHEDTQFSNRANIFLVVETLLLAAYAEIISNNSHPNVHHAAIGLPIFGFLLTLTWAVLSVKHIRTTLTPLKNELAAIDIGYGALLGSRKSWPSANNAIGIVIPTLFLILWVGAELLAWQSKPCDPARSIQVPSKTPMEMKRD